MTTWRCLLKQAPYLSVLMSDRLILRPTRRAHSRFSITCRAAFLPSAMAFCAPPAAATAADQVGRRVPRLVEAFGSHGTWSKTFLAGASAVRNRYRRKGPSLQRSPSRAPYHSDAPPVTPALRQWAHETPRSPLRCCLRFPRTVSPRDARARSPDVRGRRELSQHADGAGRLTACTTRREICSNACTLRARRVSAFDH
jgi:hypothetical protein